MAQSILEVARELIDSPEAKAAYADDPTGFVAARGLEGLSNAEFEEAVDLVAEAMPAPVARQLVAPPGPVTDSLPLARVAAATSMEVAVIEAEPGTVDLAALVDPSGQLDLPTDVGSADAAVVAPEAEVATEEADLDDSAPADEEEAVQDETEFGRGALDETDELPTDSTVDSDEGDEPDNEAVDGADVTRPEPDFDLDDGIDAPVGATTAVPDTAEEPPEDDFEDITI